MRRWIVLMVFGSIFVCAGLGSVYALDAEENEAIEVSARVDTDSHEPGDAKRLEERLEKKFDVTDARIDSLRAQGMGYGEIGLTLSLANGMPGGINDQNIQRVIDLRQGQNGHKEGWGNVAHDLGLKLNAAVKDMDDIHQDRREDRSQERAERGERTERLDRHSSVEGSTRTRAQVSANGGSMGAENHGSIGLHEGIGIGRH